MITLPPRLATLLLASLAGGGFVSCTSDSGPDGNIFLSDRAPRYGHGGSDSPRYKYGATETGEPASRGETKYLNDRKPREQAPREPSPSEEPTTGGSEETAGATDTTDAPPRRLDPAPETEDPTPEPTPEPKPKPTVSEDIPYATPVPGQEGKVYSPFHNGGYVDVSGMPSGSKAKCPYTKKIFRVP